MGIGDMLGKAYMKVEDAYYGVLDFFEEKGIGLPWTYNDFLESKGVPALPVTFALFILLASGGLWVATANQPQDITFALSLNDDKGRALEDVSIRVLDESGAVLETLTASDGTVITLTGVAPNAQLTVQATKSGYGTKTGVLYAGTDQLELSLEGANDAIVGKLKLVDGETNTTITDAVVRAEWTGGDVPLVVSPGAGGIVLLNVPLDQEISLTVSTDNYEELIDTITFSNGDVKIKELAPKASASSGPSVLTVKAVDAKTQLPMEGVHVKIENAPTNEIISDLDVPSGVHTENLTKGQVVRVSVSKEGYLTYTTSTDFPEGKTLRKDSEVIIAPLAFGGASLHVITSNTSNNQVLQGVDVALLDVQDAKADGQTTGFAGEAVFPGLMQTQSYTLLAFHPNFFPVRQRVDWSTLPDADDGKTLALALTAFTSGDAGVLTVFVSDADGKAASGAGISLDEKVEGAFVPLIASRSADSLGSFTARVKVGTVVRATAQTDAGNASRETIVAAGLNKIVLTLNQNTKPIAFHLSHVNGQAFAGNAELVTSGGNEWFNGAASGGNFTALVPTNQPITLTAHSSTGSTYTRTITIAPEKDTVDIVLDSASGTSGSAPEVNFEGLFSLDGVPIAGLSPESDALARFTVKWPAGAGKGGLFVRTGEDAVASVDSQFVGIYGLNGDADAVTYGKSWTPIPQPGNEAKDRKTIGKAGSLSKWIEIVQDSPLGTSTFDVRLKARAGTPEGMVPLAYRAFAESGGNVLRTPADAVLGNAGYTSAKSGLYANTLSASLPVYASQPFCQGGICATLQFVDNENRRYPIGGFQAQNGQVYAIEVSILPVLAGGAPTPATATITAASSPTSTGEGLIPLPATLAKNGYTLKASTSNENPLLVFTKTEVGAFAAFADTGNKDTSVSASIPLVDARMGAQARVQFAPQEVGQAVMNVQLVSSTQSWTQTLSLEIVEPKFLNVAIPTHANPREAIPITVLDDQGSPVPNALITLTNANGKFAASTKGTGSANRGENGRYVIDKSLDAGLYRVTVKVPGFVDAQGTLAVGVSSPLSLPSKITIAIPFGKTSVTQQVSITNTTAYSISNITGELITFDSIPEELKIDIGTLSALAPNGKGNLSLTATYTGDSTDQTTRMGTATLRVRGEAAQQFPVQGESALTVSYNPPLDPTCLQFDKSQLSVQIMGETQPYGNLYNGANGQVNSNAQYYGFSQSPIQNGLPANANGSGFNAFGVDASGAYQNAEQKRVSVKVQNNCGVDLSLIPGISIADGQAEVDGLKLAAVDSAFSLAKGQSRSVDFTITNDLFRAGFVPQRVQYAALFRAAQVQASIPIAIQFWDRSRAIQTPSSIQLTLIKTGNSKATDRANVPILNLGSGTIYDVRAALEGESVSDVTIKLENNPGSNASQSTYNNANYPILISESGNARGTLQPGQAMYPPLAVVAESLRETTGDFHKTLTITGVIEGRRVTLKQLDVYVRTGSSSCLQLSAFDTPISLVSSELTGTIAKRVTLQNKCLEPVRVTQVNPAALGANTFTLTPLDGTDILDKDALQEFQIQLTKGTAMKSQINLNVKGILLLSQKAIESNPVAVEVRLGANELQSTNATNSVSVNVCEGGTMNVRFPLLAKKTECSQAYCDATQASGMLADAMEQTIAKVTQQMQAKHNDASQFSNCDIIQRYCTFAQLGVKSPTLDVYLQNDGLTPGVLNYVMRGGTYPRLAGMQAETLAQLAAENADAAFAQQLGNGLGNKVLLPEIRGCGYYQLVLVGGVEVATNQLQPDQLTIGFKLKSPKQTTAECQDKIFNAANFLPKDNGLGAGNAQGTQLGMVEYETGLKQPAEWLAQTVFGSETRAEANTQSNRLHLRVGNLSESIIEMTLDASTNGDQPKNIFTTVRKTGGDVQKEVVVEAGKILTSLGKNVNGCITRDERTWKIYSAKDAGEFTFAGCALPGTSEGGLVVRANLACCSLTAKSDIASDASFSVDPRGASALPGVTQLDLYETQTPAPGSNLVRPGTKIENGSPYPLVFNNATRAYEKQVLLCATSDPRTQQLANKAIVQASASRTLDETKAGPIKIQLKTCSLDASDALARAHNKGTGTWFATLDWADDADSKTILQTVEDATQKNKLGNAYVSYAGQGILANDNPVYKSQLHDKELASMGKFAATCALSCGLCQGGLALASLGTTLGGGALDCLAACGAGTAAGAYELYKDNADGTILETPKDIVETVYGIPRDIAEVAVPGSGENQAGASALFAGTVASAIKSKASPLQSKAGKDIVAYADPKKVITEADLKFLSDAPGEINTQVENVRKQVNTWNGEFKKVVSEKGKLTIVTPTEFQAIEAGGKLDQANAAIANLKTKTNAGYEKLLKDHADSPGFDSAATRTAQQNAEKELVALENEISRIRGKFTAMETAEIVPVSSNELVLTTAQGNAAKITKDSLAAGQKLEYPQKWYQTKKATAVKNFARSFVCGGIGSAAGYAAYRTGLSEEVENKIELDIGSGNVLDPATNVLTFHKGQTYKFVVQPGPGTGVSQKMFVDVLSPDVQVTPSAWLDDCAQK